MASFQFNSITILINYPSGNSVREDDGGSRNDKLDLFHKFQLYNESYKVVAAARSQNDDGNDKDNEGHKEQQNNKGPMGKCSSHHAAMSQVAKEKKQVFE